MRQRAFALSSIAVVAALSFAGCAADVGAAPAISGLSVMPGSVSVGSTSTLTGSLQFQDVDGDVMDLNITVRTPEGTSVPLAPTPVTGASGVAVGNVTFLVALAPPTPGRYMITTYVRDTEGNVSNTLETPIDAM